MAHRLAAVFAHPDDDTYGNAGSLALVEGDLEYTLIVATSGEAGSIADPSLATPESLGEVREAEQRASLSSVGVDGGAVHFLRYPDGGLAEVPPGELAGRIVEILRAARPHVVLTFGPEGITRHADHIAVHQATTDAFHRLQAEAGGDAFHRLFYVAFPHSTMERFWKETRATGIDIGEPEDPFMPRGVPDETISVRVDCRQVLDRKLAAIRAHRTQAGDFLAIPATLQEDIFGTECFVQAWPPVTDPMGPSLGSVFEGLDAAGQW